jgi:predicted unusual protein kinase regulating ubiquinone biosynthesis (AarF/ABC1/UbiB family)
MELFVRLVRALWVFGIIFLSYMIQLALVRMFRNIGDDPRTGRERIYVPEGLRRRRHAVDEINAKRLLAATLRLRGVYIKLGQVLSIMGGFLPPVYGKTLSVLQDKVPPHPYSALVERFRESLGKDPEEFFERIEKEPIAAASLGQVHAAWLPDGRKCAVKFLYPGIRGVIRTDMRVIRLALHVYEWFVPVENIESAYHALVDLLRRETDYIHEAECMERMAENFRGQDDLRFPEVVHEVTTAEVLTMTFMEGFKINDVEEMDRRGIGRREVATRLTQSFYEQLFVHRFFHADPHPGNFLIEDDGDGKFGIVVLDFGAISEVADEMIEGMVDVLQGFFEQEDSLVLHGFERIGFVSESGNRALVERTVITYFRKLLKVRDRTAGALMRANRAELEALVDPEVARQELRELMRSIRYPDGWFYVERASVLAFWLVGQIDPELDTLEVGFPYVMPMLMKRTMERAAQ